MQVFVPYPDLQQSVSVLDPSRLGNQIYREVLTLIRGGWWHHPAAKMWAAHKGALARYALAGLDELERRGKAYPHHRITFEIYCDVFPDPALPSWWGRSEVHLSHQSNLIRKDPGYYAPLFPGVSSDLPYVWVA